jgi:hypothetical protein
MHLIRQYFWRIENRFKMLEFYRVCSAFESVFAATLGVTYYF